MWIVVVVVMAALVGGGVYLLSVRSMLGAGRKAGTEPVAQSSRPAERAATATAASSWSGAGAPAATQATTPAAASTAAPATTATPVTTAAPTDPPVQRRRFLRRSKAGADAREWRGVQPAGERAAETYVYIPLSIDEPPDLITRLAKLLVLIAVVSVTGLLVALGLWQVGQLIGRAIEGYFAGG